MPRSRRAAHPREAAPATRTPLTAPPNGVRRSKLRLVGVALLCAKVALVPLVFDVSLDWPFVVAKALLSHALAYVLVAVIAGLLLRFGRSFFVWSWLHVPVLAFLAVSALATVFAVDPSLALYGAHARMLGLATLADLVVLYFGIVLLVRTRGEAVALAASAFGASAIVLGYEVVQLLGRDPLRWDTDTSLRPISTIGNATTLAQYLGVLAVGALALGLLLDRLDRRLRAILVAYAGALALGAVATSTRSVLLGLGAGAAFLVVAVWLVHPSRRARAISFVGAAASAAALAGVLFFTPLGARLASTVEPPRSEDDTDVFARFEPATAARLALYAISVDIVRERPILGYGPDNFAAGVPRYRPERVPELRQTIATSAHSWVAQTATSTGVVGLACFVTIILVALGLAIRRGFRPAALAAGGMLAAFLGTGLTTANDVSTEWLFWASLGAIGASTAALENAATPRATRGPSPRRRDGQVGRVAAVALVGLAALVGASGTTALGASRWARDAQLARLGGQPRAAVDSGVRATREDPRRAEYWSVLGLAYASSARYADASAAFERATRLAPYDARYVGDRARAELFLSNADTAARARALELGDQAIRLDPNNPMANVTRAVVRQYLGDGEQALLSIERALALDPGSLNPDLYLAATQIMRAAGRTAEAIRVARDGVAALGGVPASIPLRVELARALVADGKPMDALKELDIALSIQSNEAAERLRTEIRATLPP